MPSDHVVVILEARERARNLVAIGKDDRFYFPRTRIGNDDATPDTALMTAGRMAAPGARPCCCRSDFASALNTDPTQVGG